MKNALVLKLMDYSPATEDFMYVLDILSSTDEKSLNFRQILDDKIEEVEISSDDFKNENELVVISKIILSLHEMGVKIIHTCSNREIQKFTIANTIPNMIYKAWISESRNFYISSLTELSLQLGDTIYRFKK